MWVVANTPRQAPLTKLSFRMNAERKLRGGFDLNSTQVHSGTDDDPLWQQLRKSAFGESITFEISVPTEGADYRVILSATTVRHSKADQDITLEEGEDGEEIIRSMTPRKRNITEEEAIVQVDDGILNITVEPNNRDGA